MSGNKCGTKNPAKMFRLYPNVSFWALFKSIEKKIVYALDENFHGHVCLRRKAANFLKLENI